TPRVDEPRASPSLRRRGRAFSRSPPVQATQRPPYRRAARCVALGPRRALPPASRNDAVAVACPALRFERGVERSHLLTQRNQLGRQTALQLGRSLEEQKGAGSLPRTPQPVAQPEV